MADFDKPRCVRIISETIDVIDECLKEHGSVGEYANVEEFLEIDAEMRLDWRAMTELKEYLEQDCE